MLGFCMKVLHVIKVRKGIGWAKAQGQLGLINYCILGSLFLPKELTGVFGGLQSVVEPIKAHNYFIHYKHKPGDNARYFCHTLLLFGLSAKIEEKRKREEEKRNIEEQQVYYLLYENVETMPLK